MFATPTKGPGTAPIVKPGTAIEPMVYVPDGTLLCRVAKPHTWVVARRATSDVDKTVLKAWNMIVEVRRMPVLLIDTERTCVVLYHLRRQFDHSCTLFSVPQPLITGVTL